MLIIKGFIFVFIAFFIVPCSFAKDDIAGSRDSDFVERYPRSVIAYFSETDTDDYTLFTSSLKKVNGVWVTDRKQRLSGHLMRISYQIVDDHTEDMVAAFFEKQFVRKNARELFACQKRACGDSNEWANGVFGVRQLYGSDRDQRYRVVSFNKGKEEIYVALYIIKRGNGRIFAHVDVLVSSDGDTNNNIVEQLASGQKVILRGAVSPKMIRKIAEFLQLHPDKKLYLVGHSYAEEAVESLREKSRGSAQSLAKQLPAEYQQRVDVYGLGPLAPANSLSQGQDRVEVIPY